VVLLVAVAASLGACGDDGATSADPPPAAPTTVAYTIPAGAGAAIDAGEALDILPERIELTVGDSVEIVNDDGRSHLVGPFFVEAGSTFHHTFTTPGEFEGECSVHPSGRVAVIVT
jgi:plastocyanin